MTHPADVATHAPLARALRATAARLRDGARYEWGHVGRCNCGHLVQSLTELDDAAIYRAFRHELTEWTELAQDYCSITGHDVQGLFQVLLDHGMSLRDIEQLEQLSNPAVLRRLPASRRHELRRNVRADAVAYMEAYAELLEQQGHSDQALHAPPADAAEPVAVGAD